MTCKYMTCMRVVLGIIIIIIIIIIISVSCQKETLSPLRQRSGRAIVTMGKGCSKPFRPQGQNRGSAIESKARTGKGGASEADRINIIKAERAGLDNYSDRSGARANTNNFRIFNQQGDLIRAKPNPRFDVRRAGDLYFINYHPNHMTQGKDGWFYPIKGISWGLGEADFVGQRNQSTRQRNTPTGDVGTSTVLSRGQNMSEVKAKSSDFSRDQTVG